jgi:hypothetical protein
MYDGTGQIAGREVSMAEYKYMLDNAWEGARDRLNQLEQIWDPATLCSLTAIGVTAGWSCLEVAGGGGSIARLCCQVGPGGHVMASRARDFGELPLSRSAMSWSLPDSSPFRNLRII